MHRTIALTYFAAALLSIGSSCAHAQALRFKVPFDFTVGSQMFPAGTYEVSRYPAANAILIQSQDGRLHALTTTYAADLSPADRSTSNGRAVFTQYGKQYFLHEVLCSAVSMNVELPTSRLEKRARVQEAQLPHGETVAALRTGEK